MNRQFAVAGIGELLWDVFPNHKRLGGAPANFAFHCYQLGAKAYPVSCIGTDEPGLQLRDNLRDLGVDVSHVLESDRFPTGTVQVTLKIFDVNLRQPFFSKEQVENSLRLASILKLSDEELPMLAGFFGLHGNVLEQLNELRKRFDLGLVAYTRGPDGSVLVRDTETDDAPGVKGQAMDSVGAGDSFTAALCMGVLKGWPLNRVNVFANRVASFVCSQKGATPILPEHLKKL